MHKSVKYDKEAMPRNVSQAYLIFVNQHCPHALYEIRPCWCPHTKSEFSFHDSFNLQNQIPFVLRHCTADSNKTHNTIHIYTGQEELQNSTGLVATGLTVLCNTTTQVNTSFFNKANLWIGISQHAIHPNKHYYNRSYSQLNIEVQNLNLGNIVFRRACWNSVLCCKSYSCIM